MQLTGLHHVTAVSAQIRENYRFYTQVMGMRLVKRSVNQDDVRAYHLFYSDAVGSPGNDLTFFDWNVPRERRGGRSFVRTHLRVHGEDALTFWTARLSAAGIDHSGIKERDGRHVLDFDDPEGQRLALIDDGGRGDEPVPWEQSPVPAEFQIRGLGPVVMSVPILEHTDLVLRRVMNMREAHRFPADDGAEVVVYEMNEGGPHAEIHVIEQPDLPPARSGAGGVHHVAFRTPDQKQYVAWQERLQAMGVPNSGPVDRFYFKSLYFHEGNGLLFEIATDDPGFMVDEDASTLGEKVVLPPFLEPRREEILANLKPID